jgi:hypothetical protein
MERTWTGRCLVYHRLQWEGGARTSTQTGNHGHWPHELTQINLTLRPYLLFLHCSSCLLCFLDVSSVCFKFSVLLPRCLEISPSHVSHLPLVLIYCAKYWIIPERVKIFVLDSVMSSDLTYTKQCFVRLLILPWRWRQKVFASVL